MSFLKIPGKIKNLALPGGSPRQPKRLKRSGDETGPPNREPDLHIANSLTGSNRITQSLTALETGPWPDSLQNPNEPMDEDLFQDNTFPDSISFHIIPVETQIKHLIHLLADASKIVTSLQHLDALNDARNPQILNVLNSIVTPITQLPLQTALENQSKLQSDLTTLKINIDTITTQNTNIKAELIIAMKWIRDTNTRVSALEHPPPSGWATPTKKTTPAQPTAPTTSHPTKQQTQTQTPVKLPAPPPPSNSHHPSRLVIQFPPDGLREQDKKDPHVIVKSVNIALERNPKSRHLRVVAAKFSLQGNLILSTRADQTAAELIKASDIIAPAINPNNLPISFREDKKWFKIQIDGVSTTAYALDGTGSTHNSTSIHDELSTCNPSYATAIPHIVALPRWMRTYEELRSIPRSSIVFAVDDESLAKNILLNRSLAIFGRHCSLRAYQDRPPIIQCKHCWGWNHKTDLCKKPQTCRLCSREHSETNHVEPNCNTCTAMDESGDTSMKEGLSCLHNLKCSNCIGAGLEDVSHTADARRCPSRLEKYGTTRSNERRPDTANPWKTVPSKPKKKTHPPTITTTIVTPPKANNPFIILTPDNYTPTTPSDTSLPPLPSPTSNWTTQTPSEPWI
jgi:hypothetical protein